jgi:carboxylesterase type B
VQQNAGAFGGDPARVLLAGESAGGSSVAGHLVLPSSAGLFASANIVSPGSHVGWAAGPHAQEHSDWIGPEDTLHSSESLAQALGCRGPVDLGCLRAATAEEVVKAANARGPDGKFMRFAPALPDGEFPLSLMRKGRWKRVPVVIGASSCEGCPKAEWPKAAKSLLAGRDISVNEFRADLMGKGFNETGGAAVGPEQIEEWYAGRLHKENRSQVKFRVFGDAGHACTAKLYADALQHGADPAHSGVWRYYFDLSGSKSGAHVAAHGIAMWWILGNPVFSDSSLSSLHANLSNWWYSLAAFGDPNVGSTSGLRWPAYSAESPQTLIVDEVPWVGVTEDTEARECSHWEQYLG